MIMLKKYQNIIAVPLVLITVTVILFGFFHFGSNAHLRQGATNCPFMPGHTSMCKITPSEHMQSWLTQFTVVPTKENMSALFAVLFLLFAIGAGQRIRPLVVPPAITLNISPHRQFVYIFDPLKEAFSSGILNPKVY